jgi:ABC-2 type transport system permease protein
VSWHRFWVTTVAQLKMTFRRRITLFWSLLFPIILMSLLGLLFGSSINAGTIAIAGSTGDPAAKAMILGLHHTKGVTLRQAPGAAAAIHQVKTGDRDAALVFTRTANGTRASLFTSNTSATQAGIIKGIVSGIASKVSVVATGRPPAITFNSLSVDSAQLSYVDFLMPGIVALSIMISAVYSLEAILVNWRNNGTLRRLKLTPMPLSEFFAARVTASLVIALMQVTVLVVYGHLVFNIDISSTALAAIPVALAGCLCFLALGFAIGSMVAQPETGEAVGQVITNPMMFLSGTFFPVSAMPLLLQHIAKLLPLYYLANGLRDTTVRDQPLSSVFGDIAVLLGATVILTAIALRSFRWEQTT